jgi:predicted PurR-regulated permease PerM
MSFPDRRTTNVLLTILLFATVLVVAYIARAVVIVFCFSILFAYLIDPVVRFLQRHSLFLRKLRGPHVVEAYLVLLILVAGSGYALAPGLPSRMGKLVRELPSYGDRLASGEIAIEMGHDYGWSDSQAQHAKAFLVQHRSGTQQIVKAVQDFAKTTIGAIAVIPILAIFFLSGGPRLAEQTISLFATGRNRKSLEQLATELNAMLQRYIRAKVILGGLSFAYTSIALLISGFPHPIALGLLAGVLEFIPMAGWITAAATIITFGVLSHCHWIWMVAFLGIWRILIDYWIAPRVFGRELEMPPLLAIFTLMVGGAVGGIVGAYLALPIAAVIGVVWKRIVSQRDEPTVLAAPDGLSVS